MCLQSKVAHALSRECVSILRGLLRRNPVERMSFEEFFDHPFLTGGTVCVPRVDHALTNREVKVFPDSSRAGRMFKSSEDRPGWTLA